MYCKRTDYMIYFQNDSNYQIGSIFIMAEKGQYQTRQRAELIDFLQERSGEWISARDIIDCPEVKLGEATVYRMLTRLAEEGILEKRASESGRGALYRICSTTHCKGHLHLRCLVCDNTICLHSEALHRAEEDIGSRLGFSIDESRSTLYGVCSECKGENQ